MSPTSSRRPQVLLVCSRALVHAPETGRERTMRFIHDALELGGEVKVLQLQSVLERGGVRRWLGVALRWLLSLVGGRALPLQAVLFWDADHLRLLRRQVQEIEPDTVYFDGVRTGQYLPLLRHTLPKLRMVCDFDDLMSRRMAHLAQERQPASLGYIGKHVPRWLARHVIQPLAATAIPRYEAWTLLKLERQILQGAQAVVLVSPVDARAVERTTGAAEVVVIPPAIPDPNDAWPTDWVARFVFIGSDGLLQNRSSLEYLVALWRRLQPRAELHIYGRQKGNYAQVPRVVVHGFVADVAEAYTPGSVLLAPSFVSGGVKTKVLEAMAHGVAVLGTATTFEGIEADTGALVLDDAGFSALICRPEEGMAELARHARAVVQQVRDRHSRDKLGQRWRTVVWPDAGKAA